MERKKIVWPDNIDSNVIGDLFNLDKPLGIEANREWGRQYVTKNPESKNVVNYHEPTDVEFSAEMDEQYLEKLKAISPFIYEQALYEFKRRGGATSKSTDASSSSNSKSFDAPAFVNAISLKRAAFIFVLIFLLSQYTSWARFSESFFKALFITPIVEGIFAFFKSHQKPAEVAVVETEEVYTYPPMPVWEQNALTTHGSANWDPPSVIGDRIDGGISSEEANQGGIPSLYLGGGSIFNSMRSLTHAVCVAGSGQGKGVCLILPNLLGIPHCSWFVLDPKGENALITARWQKERGQKVVILDPWNEQKRLGATHGIEPSCFNPLDFVKGNPDEMPESCGVIAAMLVPDAARSSDTYWESRARSLVRTYLLHLITARPEEEHHLGTLYRWLRLPDIERQNLWDEMMQNLACDELVKSGIGEFLSLDPYSGPFPSILSTAQDSTTFLESVQLRESLKNNEFDPYELTNGKTTVYLILPERFLDSHNRWLRLVVGVCLKACNYRPDKRVVFLLDEFAILGKMPDVQRAFAFARGQNISMWIFIQSLTQLISVYGEHEANAFLSNARLRQFFGIYDLHTQKYLSEYLGETTITLFVKSDTSSESWSTGSNTGWSAGDKSNSTSGGKSDGYSKSTSSTTNNQPMARKLLTPEEVGKTRQIITLVDAKKFLIPRIPFWDDIVEAHREGRATHYPSDKLAWERFIDQVEGRMMKSTGINFAELGRADGKKVAITQSKKNRSIG